MRHFPAATLTALTLLSTTQAQTGAEDFETGNPDSWEVWFNVYNSVPASGGNPGAYLELDNVNQGPATCHFIEIFPAQNPGAQVHAHSGNWRSAGVTEVSIDLRIDEGLLGGNLELQLISDPGTPSDPSDDCTVSIERFGVMPTAGAWETLTFAVPTSEILIPINWEVDGASPCGNGSLDDAWNETVQDVDQIRFVYDDGSGAFCTFTSWIVGVDNIAVAGTGPGTNYCNANPNSTGVPARMGPTGTAVIANNDVTLRCFDLPPNTFAIFLAGDQQANAPIAGSEGILCLGGQVGRYSMPGEILSAGPAGAVSLPIDLTMIRQPSSNVNTLPGQTWNFTCWFRDFSSAGVPTSNLSDGYSVTFQ